jgi:hypothetical protein
MLPAWAKGRPGIKIYSAHHGETDNEKEQE